MAVSTGPTSVRLAADCLGLMELEREAAEGMGSRMETFEQIGGTGIGKALTRALAARYGVHRRAVRQALAAVAARQAHACRSACAELGPAGS